MPLSTVDWPGQLACVLFCRGCPWRCPYCHNPHLLETGDTLVSWAEVVAFLDRRRGLLDGVVFSGGEPLTQANLPAAMAQVKAMGIKVALHTGGAWPDRFQAVLPLVDWVGFDLKAPLADYDRITRVTGSGEKAMDSLRRLLDSGVPHQIRTTIHPKLLDATALERLGAELRSMGASETTLQPFRPNGCVDPTLLQGQEQGI